MEKRKTRRIHGGVIFREGKRGTGSYNGKRGTWYIDAKIDGERLRQKTTARTKSEALLKRGKLLSDIESGRMGLPTRKKVILLHTLADQYLEWAKDNKRSWSRDALTLVLIKKFFGNKRIDRITLQDCDRFKAARKKDNRHGRVGETVKDATVNRHLAILKKMFSWAVERDMLDHSPALKVKIEKESPGKRRILNAEEESMLLKAAGEGGMAPHLRPMILLGLFTGMRHGEVVNLEWKNVDFDHGKITATQTKSGKDRMVPVRPELMTVLASWRRERGSLGFVFPDKQGRPFKSIKTAFDLAWRRSGIRDRVTFHCLRHTFATNFLKNGNDLYSLKEILGHSSIKTTEIYLQTTEERKMQGVANIPSTDYNHDPTVTQVGSAAKVGTL